MTAPDGIPGTAALALCESLLLALNDLGALSETEIVGVLKRAAAAHETAPKGENAALHAAVVAVIRAMIAGGILVRSS